MNVEDLKIEMWPVEKPVDYARNARKITDASVAKLAAVIKEFGFKVPIIVDREGVIVAGHTRRRAARVLGMERIPVHVAKDLTPAQVKAFRIADNRMATDVKTDFELLSLELTELNDSGFNLSLTAYDEHEYQPLIAAEWRPSDDLGGLDDNEEKGPEKKKKGLIIEFTPEQYEVVKRAILAVRSNEKDTAITEARAIELIAADFLAGSDYDPEGAEQEES